MDFDLVTKEAAAISLLKRAVELDTKKRNTEALLCYKEGLQIFMEVLKSEFLSFGFTPYLFKDCHWVNLMNWSLPNLAH